MQGIHLLHCAIALALEVDTDGVVLIECRMKLSLTVLYTMVLEQHLEKINY